MNITQNDLLNTQRLENDIINNSTIEYQNLNSVNKFQLGVCLLWNEHYHGFTNNSSPNIKHHWMYEVPINNTDFMGNLDYLNEFNEHILDFLNLQDDNVPFKIQRQYRNIKIDIVEVKRLEGQEDIAIIKTCWLKFIQRKWKRLCANAKLENQHPSIKKIITF